MTAAYDFTAALWVWEARQSETWTFVTLPPDASDEIADRAGPSPRGFGAVRVSVRIGTSIWRTSIFPDRKRGSYILPVKKDVRRAQSLSPGDTARVWLELI